MNHKGTVSLETEWLILRRFTMDDVIDAYNNWLSDPDVAMYMQWDAHTDIKQSHDWVAGYYVANYDKDRFYRWAITLKDDNKAIGSVGFSIEKDYDSVADVSLTPTNEPDIFVVDFDPKGQDKLTFIEFLFNNAENGHFLYARNHNIALPLSQAILSRDRISYLAPEMVLLYKSTDTERDGYQLDYDMAIRAMSDEQKKWLRDALAVMNPNGHKWLEG